MSTLPFQTYSELKLTPTDELVRLLTEAKVKLPRPSRSNRKAQVVRLYMQHMEKRPLPYRSAEELYAMSIEEMVEAIKKTGRTIVGTGSKMRVMRSYIMDMEAPPYPFPSEDDVKRQLGQDITTLIYERTYNHVIWQRSFQYIKKTMKIDFLPSMFPVIVDWMFATKMLYDEVIKIFDVSYPEFLETHPGIYVDPTDDVDNNLYEHEDLADLHAVISYGDDGDDITTEFFISLIKDLAAGQQIGVNRNDAEDGDADDDIEDDG